MGNKRHIKYILLLLFFLIGCTQNDLEYFDPGLEQYYRTFQIEAERLGVKLPCKSIMMTMEKSEVDQDHRAHCHTGKKSIKICINSNIFKEDPGNYNSKLEATIFHELGHGILNRAHVERIGWVETSLMTSPANHKDWINGTKREFYLKELFLLQ